MAQYVIAQFFENGYKFSVQSFTEIQVWLEKKIFKQWNTRKSLTEVGFEPTPPKRPEP